MADLKPCPFCGGEAELDTRQAYRALGTGRGGTRIAAYCQDCSADIGICREDVPEVEPELVIEMWNRRAPAPQLTPCAGSCCDCGKGCTTDGVEGKVK